MDAVEAELQPLLNDVGGTHGPGLFALVADAGEVVFTGHSGTADLQRPRPITLTDRFRIASIGKIYLAVVVLQLVEERLLTADDLVSRWLPGIVPEGGITVDHLLRTRSGLPDYVPTVLGDPPDVARLQRHFPPQELVATALAQPGHLPPGQGWRYCNTDYILLGLIVEAVTGQPLDHVLAQRLFTPLGLTSTYLPVHELNVAGPHARGYLRLTPDQPYQDCTDFAPSEAWAAGAIISTPLEVVDFLEALFGRRLLPAHQVAAMRQMTHTGRDLDYGRGLFSYRLPNGPTLYGHGGTHFGVNCLAFRAGTARALVLYRNSWDRPAGGLHLASPFIRAVFSS